MKGGGSWWANDGVQVMRCDGKHAKGDGPWWVNDARGLPLARMCSECRREKLKGFRPKVLSNPNYEANEPIEPEE